MDKAFCIGNGTSRLGFDLNKLRGKGTIMGCNALYREFKPDVLVCVDNGIMHEAYQTGIASEIDFYGRNWTKVPALGSLGGQPSIRQGLDPKHCCC